MKKRKNGRKSEKENSMNIYKTYILAFIIELLVFCTILSLFSILIVKSGVPDTIVPLLSIITFAVSAFAAGFIAVRPKRKNGIITGCISAVPLMVATAILIVLLNKGSVSYVLIITVAVQVLASMAGGISAANMRKRVK